MIRVTRKLIRFIGWLLTPLVVWAAAFLGGWLGALIGEGMESPKRAILFIVAGAFLGAVSATILWAWGLRRSARVQAWGRRRLRQITHHEKPAKSSERSDPVAQPGTVESKRIPSSDGGVVERPDG